MTLSAPNTYTFLISLLCIRRPKSDEIVLLASRFHPLAYPLSSLRQCLVRLVLYITFPSIRELAFFINSGLANSRQLPHTVPLATLISASLPPSNPKSEGSKPAILSPQGRKRYFVVHGGPPVSKDGVLLEEVAKIDR